MQRERTDILISGGGVAGLTAAAAFGAAGFRVLCVDPAPPVTEAGGAGADLRTTALLQPSVALLERVGVWPRLAPHAAALRVMRLVDAGGAEPTPRRIRDFDAAEISDGPFGWNLPNWCLSRALTARLEALDAVEFRPGTGTRDVLARDREALVRLTDGRQVATRLLVAADGRASPVREAAGIGVRRMRYGQKALAFAVTHPVAHENVSTEIHRQGGPFTLVPLPDRDGVPCSGVVWMDRGPGILRRAALAPAEFEAEMSARSGGLFGPLTLASRRSVWPIVSQIADRLTARRTALIAEAAHVVPPIGAQGLNMSLADIRALLDLAGADPDGLGGEDMLAAYARRRRPEIAARVAGVDMLNRAAMQGAPGLRDLRAGALDALYSAAPLRRAMMRAGLGATG